MSRGPAWTDEEMLAALALRDRGRTNKQIAKVIGRPEVSVRSKLKQIDRDMKEAET